MLHLIAWFLSFFNHIHPPCLRAAMVRSVGTRFLHLLVILSLLAQSFVGVVVPAMAAGLVRPEVGSASGEATELLATRNTRLKLPKLRRLVLVKK